MFNFQSFSHLRQLLTLKSKSSCQHNALKWNILVLIMNAMLKMIVCNSLKIYNNKYTSG